MIGARLGPWLLDREIGRGGMAVVYHARADPPVDGPTVAAVKVLAAELATEPGFVLRFQREIEIVRKLDHPNIVRCFDSGVQDGRPWFAMEYVDGPSFDAILERQGRLPWRDVVEIACQIAPALKHAHDRGVIHRDLKPSNLLEERVRGQGSGVREEDAEASALTPDPCPLTPWSVKLGDFGVASLFASRHLTVTGGVVGTAEFLSPEQAAGKPVTRRSDLYSFGVVLYLLLTGRPPFQGEVLDLLHKHRFAQFDAPIRITPEMPHDLNALICELMEKDPGKRPSDGGVLFRRLDALRRKVARQESMPTTAPDSYIEADATDANEQGREGSATLMSRLMRRELEGQNRGGPARRLLNRPAVLITLFAIAISTIVWTLWPLSEEQLYRRAAAAAASANPDDWDRAIEYLDDLDRDHPHHAHHADVDELRRRLAEHTAGRPAERAARTAGPMSEAQWFFQEGMRLRQRGDVDGARRTWTALASAFGQTPSEKPWARLAEKELAWLGAPADPVPVDRGRSWEPVRETVRRAKQLREDGKADEADAVLQGLRELYRGDAEAEAIIHE